MEVFCIFLGIPSLLFSETLQLIRAFNSEKFSKCFFEKNPVLPILAKNCPKLAIGPKCSKMEVFRIFLGIPSLLFSETLLLIRAFNSEKNGPNAFLKKIPFCPFWPAILLDVCSSLFKGWKSLKNLKVGVFETNFKQVPFIFWQTTHTYSESWGPVENVFENHFNLEYLDLPKFKLFDEPLQCGLAI